MNQNASFINSLQNWSIKIVKIFFPIQAKEIKKYLPTAMMMFIILFNYNIVRILKDSFIIGDAGAEVVNFLKPFVVLPASLLFVIFYSKMSNSFSEKNVFYVSVLPFIAFNIIFTHILYPNVSWLHPSAETIAGLKASYPKLRSIFPVYGLWTYSLYYTFSELWGTVAMNLLFWQFVNRIVSTDEAKRFYPSFGLVGNIGFTLGSVLLLKTVTVATKDTGAFAKQFTNVMNIVILLSFALVVLYWAINKFVLSDPSMLPCEEKVKKKKKAKPSLSESFKIVFSSKYLGLIMLLIFSYNAMINLVEVTWKSQVKAYTSVADKEISKANYTAFVARTNIYTGLVSIALFVAANYLLSRFKWIISASITPIIMVSTSVLFFLFTVFPSIATPMTAFFSSTPLFMAVVFGAIQNVASKSTKYSLFDPTKEMTYIPLDKELKSKGKAAVDIAGSRISKSFGSALQGVLLTVFGFSTQLQIAPYLMIFVISIGILWFIAVKLLAKEYASALQEKCEEDKK
ncbi:NTP/NDP exchange transporter [Candidatus Cytomitobacter indipagum]|uniref:ADP,ATP carrier protein n=1 Tax=Candidatus Cytomitobacter indipagum TaxID=2601575 RepID=A0A5C0UDW4_9PROT|nr:Npt1/Npt2 family nucleotide transporter [Candidatus Cytomitobacter indipagum]QEK37833.1 NTP/NDP exchange transporter [Candidatus Cytomitobacter indipagum]